MTNEFAILLALFGVAIAWMARSRHSRISDVRPVGVAWEVYGAGLAALAAVSVFAGGTLANRLLAAWFLGGY